MSGSAAGHFDERARHVRVIGDVVTAILANAQGEGKTARLADIQITPE